MPARSQQQAKPAQKSKMKVVRTKRSILRHYAALAKQADTGPHVSLTGMTEEELMAMLR
jgi:hypothetical protein